MATMPETPPLPPVDELLRRVAEQVTEPADTDSVLAAISMRRQTLRTRAQRRRMFALVSTAAASVVICALLATRFHDGSTEQVESVEPATVTGSAPELVPGGTTDHVSSPDATVRVPGDGMRIVPLVSGDGFWISRGDPVDATDPVVSTISHVGADGDIGAVAEIHGVPLAAVEDGPRLWVVSEDRVISATDSTRYRLKQIDTQTGEVLSSTALGSSMPVGMYIAEGSVAVAQTDATTIVDPTTLVPRRQPRSDASGVSHRQLLVTGAMSWGVADSDRVTVTHVGTVESSQPLDLPGMHQLVAADVWGDGSAATAVTGSDGADVVELIAPSISDRTGVITTRIRVAGLPSGAQLMAVAPGEVWLLVDADLVAVAAG